MEELLNILKYVHIETMDSIALVAKTGEEFGEFCEACLKDAGHLIHKQEKETNPVDELADMIMCALAAIKKLPSYKDMPDEALIDNLEIALFMKTERWKGLLRIDDGD